MTRELAGCSDPQVVAFVRLHAEELINDKLAHTPGFSTNDFLSYRDPSARILTASRLQLDPSTANTSFEMRIVIPSGMEFPKTEKNMIRFYANRTAVRGMSQVVNHRDFRLGPHENHDGVEGDIAWHDETVTTTPFGGSDTTVEAGAKRMRITSQQQLAEYLRRLVTDVDEIAETW